MAVSRQTGRNSGSRRRATRAHNSSALPLPPSTTQAIHVAHRPTLTGVEGVKVLADGAAVDAVALNQAHQHNLGQQDSDDGLGVDEGGVAEVVNAALREDLGARLEPDGLAKVGGAVALQQLGGDAAQGACGGDRARGDAGCTSG
jgi:hypothetical protein